jgi:hypothetical protein
VPGTAPGAYDIAGELETFARYGDSAWVLEQERLMMERIAEDLRREGYPLLARYVELRPAGTDTLLAWAARYFFRREWETDERLSTALIVDQLAGTRYELQRFEALVAAALSSQVSEINRLNQLLHEWKERLPPAAPAAEAVPPKQLAPARTRLISELFDPPPGGNSQQESHQSSS